MDEAQFRSLIRLIIESETTVTTADENPRDLLAEPDDSDDKSSQEASGAGAAGGGPAMPLGAGPSYPGPERRSRKSARREITRVTGSAFGGARPIKKI